MLYILLPVHNRKEITRQFINCLKKQTFKNYHLVVIDDGSTDGTAQMIREEMPNATILKGNGKLWWAGSLQRGINWLKKNALDNDSVLIINDDVIFKSDYLKMGVKLLDENNEMIIGSKAYSMQTGELVDSGVMIEWRPLRFLSAEDSININCFSTRGIFLRMITIKKIGNFHPFLLPHYISDYEYTYRAHKKGIKIITDNILYLYKNEITTGYKNIKYLNLRDFIKKYFSKKNPNNIFYLIIFILIAAPFKYKFQEIYYISKKQIVILIKSVRKSKNGKSNNSCYSL